MRFKFICGAVTRTFTMVALGSFFVSVNLAIAGPSVQEQLKGSCYAHQTSNGHVSTYRDSVDFSTKYYSTSRFDSKKAKWNKVLKIQQELKAKNCQGQIRNYATKFFRAALKANDKSCSNKDSLCAEYNNWAQNLYESALKNDDTIIINMLNKHSSYISKKAAEEAAKKKAAEDAKKKAAKEAAKKADEAAKNKAAKENDGEEVASKLKSEELVMPQKYEGRCGQELEVNTYSLDNTVFKCDFNGLSKIERDEMIDAAYAIMETDPDYFNFERMAKRRSMKNNSTEEKDTLKKNTIEDATAKENAKVKVYEINTNDKVNNGTEKAEAYITIDLNNTLKKMNFDDMQTVNKLSVIKNIKIEKLTDEIKMKTINSQGITRTMYCKPKCTLGSPMLQTNSTGIDMGMPKVIYDGISEALNETFGGENPLKKSQIIKLGIGCYKELAKTINDPNINKAITMPAEQLKQIKSQQRKTQASSNKSSGGSAKGHDHDHDHEEEDWRTAPGSIYYD